MVIVVAKATEKAVAVSSGNPLSTSSAVRIERTIAVSVATKGIGRERLKIVFRYTPRTDPPNIECRSVRLNMMFLDITRGMLMDPINIPVNKASR